MDHGPADSGRKRSANEMAATSQDDCHVDPSWKKQRKPCFDLDFYLLEEEKDVADIEAETFARECVEDLDELAEKLDSEDTNGIFCFSFDEKDVTCGSDCSSYYSDDTEYSTCIYEDDSSHHIQYSEADEYARKLNHAAVGRRLDSAELLSISTWRFGGIGREHEPKWYGPFIDLSTVSADEMKEYQACKFSLLGTHMDLSAPTSESKEEWEKYYRLKAIHIAKKWIDVADMRPCFGDGTEVTKEEKSKCPWLWDTQEAKDIDRLCSMVDLSFMRKISDEEARKGIFAFDEQWRSEQNKN